MENSEAAERELVWAKFSRYPWWPAIVLARGAGETAEVEFFGTFERSVLRECNLRPFAEPPTFDPKALRNKGLQAAIASVSAVSEGASTVEEEREKARRGTRTPSPHRLRLALAKVGAPTPASDTAQSDIGSALNAPLEIAPPFEERIGESPLCELPFGEIQKAFNSAFEQLFVASDFSRAFEQFCFAVRALLSARHTNELITSNVGRTLVHCKSQLQTAEIGKEIRRRALADLNALIDSMKRRIVEHFFESTESVGESVSDKIMEIASLSNDVEVRFASPPANAFPRLAARKLSESDAADEPREKFKLSVEVKNRVLKKFSKCFSQFSPQKITKSDAEKLARFVHQKVIERSESLIQYKRAVVSFVHSRQQLDDFFASKYSSDPKQSLESARDEILQLLLG